MLHQDEQARLRSLHSYSILDTLPEQDFDDITLIASTICGMPIAAVSLIDENRQWFKSKIGLAVDETPRDIAFCHHAIQQPASVFLVEDARQDARFSDNPLVLNDPSIRFYAGIPLVVADGHALGTLCVIDNKPGCLSDRQRTALQALGRRAVSQLEIRKTNQELALRNDELGQFAYRVSHDFKAPLSISKQLSEFLIADIEADNLTEAKANASRINQQMQKLDAFVGDILNLARADLAKDEADNVNLRSLMAEIEDAQQDLIAKAGLEVFIKIEPTLTVTVPRVRLQQILSNLLSNSLKYRDTKKPNSFVRISGSATNNGLQLTIEDNGVGIPQENQQQVGNLFKRFHPNLAKGTGLGLAIVYKHVEALEAEIDLQSTSEGTSFSIRIPLISSAD